MLLGPGISMIIDISRGDRGEVTGWADVTFGFSFVSRDLD